MRKWIISCVMVLFALGSLRMVTADWHFAITQPDKQGGWDESGHSAWPGDPPDTVSRSATAPAPTQDSGSSAGGQSAKQTETTLAPASSEPPHLFGIALGMTDKQVIAALGQPARREPSPLGYEWWIYNRDYNRYVQIGILSGKVVDIYSNSAQASVGTVSVGTRQQSLSRKQAIDKIVSFPYENANVQITNQTTERPLVFVATSPVIYYIDKQNSDKVTAIRLLDKLVLLRGSFYETKWSYLGKSPNFNPPILNSQEQEAVNSAHERQILDLINGIRYRYGLPSVSWHEQAAEVARAHSKDMNSNHFFGHTSATTGLDPFQRLKQAGIDYQLAGENIAAGFPDAIEAYESWMNSPGHRKNILEKDFRQLGVGVYFDYYTQDFVTVKQ